MRIINDPEVENAFIARGWNAVDAIVLSVIFFAGLMALLSYWGY